MVVVNQAQRHKPTEHSSGATERGEKVGCLAFVAHLDRRFGIGKNATPWRLTKAAYLLSFTAELPKKESSDSHPNPLVFAAAPLRVHFIDVQSCHPLPAATPCTVGKT